MELIGIDVHKRESQVCILAAEGEVVGEQRIRTERGRFAELLGTRPKARILMEASTESEWVARCLEALGHEVVVANPNFSPMYATHSRKVKTDKRDARTLAEACKLGAYKSAHRASDARRHLKAQLAVREALVRTRAKYISLARALVRREGLTIGTGDAEHFAKRVAAAKQQGPSHGGGGPCCWRSMQQLNEQIASLDGWLEWVARQDTQVANLCTAPLVGPVTASAFVACVDDPKRFKAPHRVEAYVGLVPSKLSSGEKQRKGRITKTGNARVSWLLVQPALSILRRHRPQVEPPAHLGRAHRLAPRQEDRRGGSGTQAGGHSLRHDAQGHTVHAATSAAPAATHLEVVAA